MEPGRIIYVIRSCVNESQWYVGSTSELTRRIEEHNDGRSPHTSKYRPWKLVVSLRFADGYRALAFEKYLKSGSGRAFSRRHFR